MVRRLGELGAKFESGLLFFLIWMLLAFVVAAITVRYTPFSGLWANELARLFLLWAAFISAGSVEKVNGHFRVGGFENLFSGKAQLLVQLFLKLVVLISIGLVIWWTIVYSETTIGQLTYLLRWPWITRAIPLICGSLLIFAYCLANFIQIFRRLFE